VEANLPRRAMGIALTRPGQVEASSVGAFRREPPPKAPAAGPLHAKVLVNFASRDVASALDPKNIDPVLATLRAMVRSGRISTFSVVAFLLTDQRAFYRQKESAGIDFPALGKAIQALELGTVEYERLKLERGQRWFLAELLEQEIGQEPRPDVLIIVSPRLLMWKDVPDKDLKKLGPPGFPVFYIKTGRIPLPDQTDAIGRVIRLFKGREYRILKPEEIGRAVVDLTNRVQKRSAGHGSSPSAPGVK